VFLILNFTCIIFKLSYEICLEMTVVSLSRYNVSFLILLDFMRLFFFGTVCLIAASIFFFRSSYIRSDKVSNRFLAVVLLFITSMSLLIFRPNLIRLLLGWDGLGVTSYLLVCYYRREKRFNARILTALSNRVGDVIILVLIALNITPGILNYGIYSCCNGNLIKIISLIIIAGITKSAQIPFSAWLPAAMAAPTPVSALVHSSTLVTAGVYLLIRFNFLLANRKTRILTVWVGCMTIIIAGLAALSELDMKKIIALSTLSQLGVIFFTLGVGEIFLRWIHLIRHAYFKAIIFIGAGAIIHSMSGYQDTRKIGSLNKNNFYISRIYLSRSLRLCGIPFISGFYSKDAILEQFFINSFDAWICVIVFIATIFTVIYSMRVLIMLFIFFSARERLSSERDSNRRMRVGIIILFFPATIGGLLLRSWRQTPILVELPLWLKISVLLGVFSTAVLIKVINPNTIPKSFLKSGFHQIWFLPLIIRPTSSKVFLYQSKDLLKFQEFTWSLWIVGGWAKLNIRRGYISSLFNSKLLSSLFVIIFLIILY